jgi:hypothetical protein
MHVYVQEVFKEGLFAEFHQHDPFINLRLFPFRDFYKISMWGGNYRKWRGERERSGRKWGEHVGTMALHERRTTEEIQLIKEN